MLIVSLLYNHKKICTKIIPLNVYTKNISYIIIIQKIKKLNQKITH